MVHKEAGTVESAYPNNGGYLWQKEITVSDLMRIVYAI